jgi:predicted acylesterase/phospholipase RssA
MSHPARSALVLQGGGALGAYELGAARALYENVDFAPDLIAGVSIGAITAVLLARPARGRKPLEALEAFWDKVTVSGSLLPPFLQQYASFFGNPNFFVPRHDYLSPPTWTNIYDTTPLHHTLSQLVDLDALADRSAAPGLLVSATNVEEGQIKYFYSRDDGLSLLPGVSSPCMAVESGSSLRLPIQPRELPPSKFAAADLQTRPLSPRIARLAR